MFKLAVTCVLVAVPLAAGQGKAVRKGDQIDRLARRLENDARELREEVLTHFRKSRAFKDLEKHAREIERQAVRIHKLTDLKARPKLVRDALDKMDDEVHHLERHVRDMARDKTIDRRALGHLRDELTDIDRTLHRILKALP